MEINNTSLLGTCCLVAYDPKTGWENILEIDKVIIEKYRGNDLSKRKRNDERYRSRTRFVFGKCQNSLNEIYYRFLGIYEFDNFDEETSTSTFIRVSDELDLTPFIR